ncbi:MAG: hypothetical protein FWH38_03070, partial [Treponema sp.]|nr:hypothetical protein [Treponema sp.]
AVPSAMPAALPPDLPPAMQEIQETDTQPFVPDAAGGGNTENSGAALYFTEDGDSGYGLEIPSYNPLLD